MCAGKKGSSRGACRCLRRGARCTCAEDASWLARKREPLPAAYVAPPLRRAVLAPAVECRCLRRQGRCSCVADAAWLARKRRRVETYVAPHRKERERELEERRRAIAEKVGAESQLESCFSAAKHAKPHFYTIFTT